MESPDGYFLLFCSVPVLIVIGCLIAAFSKKYRKVGLIFIIVSVVILILGIGACFNNIHLGNMN